MVALISHHSSLLTNNVIIILVVVVVYDQLCKIPWYRVTPCGYHIHSPIFTPLPMVYTQIIRPSNSCPLYSHLLLHK